MAGGSTGLGTRGELSLPPHWSNNQRSACTHATGATPYMPRPPGLPSQRRVARRVLPADRDDNQPECEPAAVLYRLDVAPRVTYSMRRQDIHAEEAAGLLWMAWEQARQEPASQAVKYWQSPPDKNDVARISAALDGSLVVMAAFVHVNLSQPEPGAQEGDPSLGVWPRHLPNMFGPKTLVGMCRATGDAALTAQLYDLVVHPRVQGFGIGRKLVHMLVRQLQSKGIYDVGTVCPGTLEPFFRRCQFTDDPEQSTFMAYPRSMTTSRSSVCATSRTDSTLLAEVADMRRGMHMYAPPSVPERFSLHASSSDANSFQEQGTGSNFVARPSLQMLLQDKLKQATAENGPSEASVMYDI